ncbi:4'-phosphopantetheinyl transferase superfamily protein [Kitasatospora sp. NBC_00240]|uniref:4'-phosphopantetheinyl transferase family protein n=1 Tax=Kitasatospora sp. NBC_00240 TaxID=2903567 RepID=UPI002257443C|nr:4'-phosphopantetheinyl transferase superfamily protein [Kitasatospora sp. NBC_00240]MCX5209932.1 4'-phosphopantetheinyl transferase superfamily protein [Kitasatospora sp. NBC_00240]
MIEDLLRSPVVTAELFGDSVAVLYPEEAAAIEHAVDKRRREFTSVRVCARRALARLGRPPVPLVPGADGAPGWPPGIVGSMTHCDGYRACAVAKAEAVASLGIDAEPHLPLPSGVEEAVTLPAERAHLARLAARFPRTAWDRLLFSAKESVYKTWYPLTGRPLGFEEARVEFEPDGTFTARLLVPAPVDAFAGRWLAGETHLLTAVVHPRPATA